MTTFFERHNKKKVSPDGYGKNNHYNYTILHENS